MYMFLKQFKKRLACILFLLFISLSVNAQSFNEFREFVNWQGSGSGFFISNDGYIVTNEHVIEGAREILITGINRNFNNYYRARVIKADANYDLAILKIDYRFSSPLRYGLDWDQQNLGAEIKVLGFPKTQQLGTNIKLTSGEISSRNGENDNPNNYQISAAIQSGNSGGPVFNSFGNIIGVTVAGWQGLEFQNVNYAVKSSVLKILINSLSTSINTLSKVNLENFTNPVSEFERGTVLIYNYKITLDEFESAKSTAEERAIERARIAEQRRRQQALEDQRIRKQEAERARKEAIFVPLVQKGKSAFNQRQYQQALNFYQEAITVLPNDSRATNGINEVNDRLEFIREKEYTFYEYRDFERSDYNNIKSRIENSLNDLRGVNSEFRGTIIFSREESGRMRFEINSNVNRGYDIRSKLESIARQINLKPVSKFGYPVKSKTSVPINFSSKSKIVEATKTNVKITSKTDRSRVSSVIRYSPMGNYKVSLNYGSVNGNDFENNFVADYSGIGGPVNAFKSLIIPGAGVRSVTGGKKNGIGRAAFTYSLFGAAIGLKILSNNEYDKYLSATDQSVINDHYQNAVNYNKAFYGLLLSGALVWTYDIIWVSAKGFKNKSEQKNYKRSIALGFSSKLNSPNLTVNYSF